MNVLVLNGSPTGKNSITLQTVLLIQKYCRKNITFDTLHVGQRIRSFEKDFSESEKLLKEADLILFCYPVYTFLVPAQLHRFIALIKERGIDLSGKYATQITTSKHFYDVTAHRFIEDNCKDLGMKYIRGLSADMEDLLGKKGQKEALSFFRFILWNMKDGQCDPKRDVQEAPAGTIAIVADIRDGEEGDSLREMIRSFEQESRMKCEVHNIRTFPFRGGCLGCFNCAADGTCIYKDGFDSWLRDTIQKADAIVYAYTVQDHSMGSLFKTFDDRQFCNGHRTVTMGKPVGYLVDGCLEKEENLRMVMEARSQVGGNFLAGIASSGSGKKVQEIRMLSRTLEYAIRNHYSQPANFYGVGGLKIFRDLIYQMQGLMREDHRFYKEHGFYDFPQKKKPMIAAMYLVGAMMNNPKLRKKMGSKMTEGMLMPYQQVLKR